MEISDFVRECNHLSELANKLSELIDMSVEIIIKSEDYFSIVIHVFTNDGNCYTSENMRFDDAWNELSSMIVGARLAKGMEV